jgi:subtilase family serine protease
MVKNSKKSKKSKQSKNFKIFAIGVAVIIVLAGIYFGTTNTDAANNHANQHAVCPAPKVRAVNCHAHVVTDKKGNPLVTTSPAGYGPQQFHTAYNLPATSSTPATIAVVSAYDHPRIKQDLDRYNATYSLPEFPNCSSTVTTACFMKVNQRGGTTYPKTNSGWALETAMDVETAHQICQNCKLILVEADSNSYTNLMAAVDRARLLDAKIVSNSYGSSEFSSETSFDSHFNYTGIAFVFSSGDSGYVTSYPAASRFVTAVGGTSLYLNSDNTWRSESVWSGAGSGCSLYEPKPSFQTDSGCSRRTIADVSAAADPYTGAAVYSSVRHQGKAGWFQLGGTSLSAPIIAGVYGLGGGVDSSTRANAAIYSSFSYSTNTRDVQSGKNGSCGLYLCQGTTGYDGPSGLGTPLGFSAY